ncbi:hypothetical protein M569_01075 [Genlisea aurea]|uniref:DUF3741 domain-containing protein n=1 Tax=Genlisea aurea TaxID=192259 RepID=S8D883_9LAMI|nr:hypothetical protein M569_01075 [Genlisea aurea]
MSGVTPWAVVEKKKKRIQKPEGCVGIFLKLFDWNRRFATKKMKFIPSGVRLKEDQQPKLRLIADENRGGFPKICNGGASPPGVVARLMGLDYMPSSQQQQQQQRVEKLLESSHPSVCNNAESSPEKSPSFVYPSNDRNVEQGRFRLELRPQKLHRTNAVPSKSRKQLLPSPPATSPRKRLIGAAAAKILEPGLQRSKLKYAIAYSNDDENPSPSPSKLSCRSCGRLEDDGNIYERPFVFESPSSHYVGSPSSSQEHQNIEGVKLVPRESGKSQQCKIPVSCNYSAERKRNLNRASPPSAAIAPGSKRRSTASDPNNAAPQISNKTDGDKSETKKRIIRRANPSSPPVRKRRSTDDNICTESETSDIISIPRVVTTGGRKFEHNYRVFNCQCYGGQSLQSVDFGDDSAVKKLETPFNELEESSMAMAMAPEGHHTTSKSTSDKSCNDEKRIAKPISMSGDKLGAILEQKLKDLRSLDEESGGGKAPKKSTAMILEELISALTSDSEVPIQDEENLTCSLSSSNTTTTQGNGVAEKLFVVDNEHSTPGSCPDSIGSKGSEEYEHGEKYSKEFSMKNLENVSETLRHNALTALGMNGDRREKAEAVLLNAELSNPLVGSSGYLIEHLSIDELGSLANTLWMKFGSAALGVDDGKETNELKRFALDAALEFLNSSFEMGFINGSKLSIIKLPIRVSSTDALALEIVDVVGRWSESSRFSFDELIEREMGFSLKEWTKYETETYDYGSDFSTDLLQTLVDEAVTDLCP